MELIHCLWWIFFDANNGFENIRYDIESKYDIVYWFLAFVNRKQGKNTKSFVKDCSNKTNECWFIVIRYICKTATFWSTWQIAPFEPTGQIIANMYLLFIVPNITWHDMMNNQITKLRYTYLHQMSKTSPEITAYISKCQILLYYLVCVLI